MRVETSGRYRSFWETVFELLNYNKIIKMHLHNRKLVLFSSGLRYVRLSRF